MRPEMNKLLGMIAGSPLFSEQARRDAMDRLRDNLAIDAVWSEALESTKRLVVARGARYGCFRA